MVSNCITIHLVNPNWNVAVNCLAGALWAPRLIVCWIKRYKKKTGKLFVTLSLVSKLISKSIQGSSSVRVIWWGSVNIPWKLVVYLATCNFSLWYMLQKYTERLPSRSEKVNKKHDWQSSKLLFIIRCLPFNIKSAWKWIVIPFL